jgi:hypothetical protein
MAGSRKVARANVRAWLASAGQFVWSAVRVEHRWQWVGHVLALVGVGAVGYFIFTNVQAGHGTAWAVASAVSYLALLLAVEGVRLQHELNGGALIGSVLPARPESCEEHHDNGDFWGDRLRVRFTNQSGKEASFTATAIWEMGTEGDLDYSPWAIPWGTHDTAEITLAPGVSGFFAPLFLVESAVDGEHIAHARTVGETAETVKFKNVQRNDPRLRVIVTRRLGGVVHNETTLGFEVDYGAAPRLGVISPLSPRQARPLPEMTA